MKVKLLKKIRRMFKIEYAPYSGNYIVYNFDICATNDSIYALITPTKEEALTVAKNLILNKARRVVSYDKRVKQIYPPKNTGIKHPYNYRRAY